MTNYRAIEGFPDYSVGDDGTVWTTRYWKGGRTEWQGSRFEKGERQVLPFFTAGRRATVNLTKEDGRQFKRYVARLVLEAFVGERPGGCFAVHANGHHHDCRLGNIRWDKCRAHREGEPLSDIALEQLRMRAANGESLASVASAHGLTRQEASRMVRRLVECR